MVDAEIERGVQDALRLVLGRALQLAAGRDAVGQSDLNAPQRNFRNFEIRTAKAPLA